MKTCSNCQATFAISEEDKRFLQMLSPEIAGKTYSLPEPTHCPDCRQQRRLAWRNERKFYHRKCDLTGKQIISIYAPDSPYTVYGLDAWNSDNWDPCEYGRELDFNRPFFEQFDELLKDVPLLSLLIGACENCEYTNYSYGNKDCYLLSAADFNHNCFFSSYLTRSTDSVDCLFVDESELCYQCVDCEKCYDCTYSEQLKNCTHCLFCSYCQGCTDCIGCVNLRSQKYCILNEQLTKVEYEAKKEELLQHLSGSIQVLEDMVRNLRLTHPHRSTNQFNCEDCVGDNLVQCKVCTDCYDLQDCEDCRYVTYGVKSKSSMDVYGLPEGELNYECSAVPTCSRTVFTASSCLNAHENLYSYLMWGASNCFGCVSLHSKKYCILNKQYSEEEYFELVPNIIDHMKKTNEWGEFFPLSVAPFAYNETAAQEYFPLTEIEVAPLGGTWREEQEKESYMGPPPEFPSSIEDVDDTICDQILTCEISGKPYKIIQQELAFYRKKQLPIPRRCPDQRHAERMARRNDRKMYERSCEKCKKSVVSTYDQSRSEIVYCEKCYLDTIH